MDAETGLYYYRARYYDAQLGRFLQTDPIGYEDQMNLYAYVGSDPVNKVDPTGLSCMALPGVGNYSCNFSGGYISTVNDRKNYDPRTAAKIDIANGKQAVKEIVMEGAASAVPGGFIARFF